MSKPDIVQHRIITQINTDYEDSLTSPLSDDYIDEDMTPMEDDVYLDGLLECCEEAVREDDYDDGREDMYE